MGYNARIEKGWRQLRSGEFIPSAGPCKIRQTGRWGTWIDVPDALRGELYDSPEDGWGKGFYTAVPDVHLRKKAPKDQNALNKLKAKEKTNA